MALCFKLVRNNQRPGRNGAAMPWEATEHIYVDKDNLISVRAVVLGHCRKLGLATFDHIMHIHQHFGKAEYWISTPISCSRFFNFFTKKICDGTQIASAAKTCTR
ncbi:hypothetical protein pipiens_018509 [Culex pipiens pipiens]|uniref:Uncharacterized protein n=2 Tax=Culex pipiens TaxID=7175 RepID=A0ABD1CBH6_CULPP